MRRIFQVCLISIFIFLSCSRDGADKVSRKFAAQYLAVNEKYVNLLRSANTDSAYQQLLVQRKKDWNFLLEKIEEEEQTDYLRLLRIQLLIDLKRYENALEVTNQMTKENTPLMKEVKLQKVRVFQHLDKFGEALKIFKQIENEVPMNDQYYDILFNFAFDAEDIEDRELYSTKLIETEDWPENMLNYKSYVYQNLALIARQKGDIPKSKKILQKGIEAMKPSGNEKGLESTLNLVNMIGKPAPALFAQTWLNSGSLSFDELKGKVVVVDFWATWCGPCRQVIPTLVEEYNQLKDDGLIVIGYTRLYGRYRDDVKSIKQVNPEEEIRLTKEFLSRFNISYPIAIAHDKAGFETYRITGIPTMIMIDKEGNIADFKIGSGNPEFIRSKIKDLLS